MATDGMPLWAIKNISITLVASTVNYDLSTIGFTHVPLKIIKAFRRHNDGTTVTDTPLEILTRDEYYNLGNKPVFGAPTSIYYDPAITTDTAYVRVYPAPDTTVASTDTIFVFYQAHFEDFDVGTDEPDFPMEWYNTIKWKLAHELGFEYGVPGPRLDRIGTKADQEHEKVLGIGMEEGSVYFYPDMRTYG